MTARMEQPFTLLPLTEFLCHTRAITDGVKNLLELNCDEAAFSLKPWRMETTVEKEISGDTCVCPEATCKVEVEEIAAGISRALLQTQELREKLTLNMTKDKKRLKSSGISSIYSSKAAPSNKHTTKNAVASSKKINSVSTGKSKATDARLDIKKVGSDATNIRVAAKSMKTSNKNSTPYAKRLTTKSEQKRSTSRESMTSSEKSKTSASTSHKSSCETNEIKRTLSRSTVRSTKQNNFLAMNKLSVKNASQAGRAKISKSDTTAGEVKHVNAGKRNSAATTSELKILIEKVSSGLNTSPSKVVRESCPLHGNATHRFLKEQNFTMMDVVESLDRFHIPGDIIRALKTYHTYLKIEHSNESVDNGKRDKAINKFLIELNGMNNKDVEQNTNEAQLIHLSLEFIYMFQKILEENTKLSCPINIKKTYAELNTLWKKYGIQELDIAEVKKRPAAQEKSFYTFNASGSRSNGIWNHTYIKNCEGMSRARCIRYSNKEQLLSYFESVQQVQEIQHLKNLIDIILADIIPYLRENIDPSSAEYIRLYKMIFILFQGLNPKIPILVKTDE